MNGPPDATGDYRTLRGAVLPSGMSKKPEKPKTDAADAPKKRSVVKLAILAVVPLALAGGGWFGWTQYQASVVAHEAELAEAEAAARLEADMIKVSTVPTEIAAETSFTHSFALSVILAKECGVVPVDALKAASDEEAATDGLLVNLSWVAAARRTEALNEKTCRRLLNEVVGADAKAAEIAAARLAPPAEDGHGAAADSHGAKPDDGHGAKPEKASGH